MTAVALVLCCETNGLTDFGFYSSWGCLSKGGFALLLKKIKRPSFGLLVLPRVGGITVAWSVRTKLQQARESWLQWMKWKKGEGGITATADHYYYWWDSAFCTWPTSILIMCICWSRVAILSASFFVRFICSVRFCCGTAISCLLVGMLRLFRYLRQRAFEAFARKDFSFFPPFSLVYYFLLSIIGWRNWYSTR